jgi:hypothetical protein
LDYQKKLDIVKELVEPCDITTYTIDDIFNISEDVFNSKYSKYNILLYDNKYRKEEELN